jgi:glycerol-3-phosphate dehydrogenase
VNIQPFGRPERLAALEAMAGQPLDLLVIGGGITGCGLARDAALRGLTVGLVEKADFGSGTSSRSSKLVHGGVRYLAHGDVALVRESAHERRVLGAIAPHLVHPLPFVYPLFKGDSTARMRVGFTLFDRLAGSAPNQRHRVLSAADVRELLPGLREPLAGGIQFMEYITDDARLTLENAMSASQHGAFVASYAAVTSFLVEDGRLVGARVRDELDGGMRDVRATVVVNATGPWAEATIGLGDSPAPKHVLPSKGIHLLFRADRLPVEGAVALKSPAGREGFAIRRWSHVYVGTSDVAHAGSLEAPVADRAAVDDVLRMTQDCFPALGLTSADVVATWAGLRPLIAEEGKAPRDTSRHDEVWRSPEGLLSIAGGKLTTYRRMGERVMVHVGRALGRDVGRGPRNTERTATVPLPGAELGGRDFGSFREATRAALVGRGVTPEAAERITWLYGAGAEALLRLGADDPAWLEPLAPGCAAVRGEVKLAVEQAMALTLADILDRRTGLLLFSDDHGLAAAPRAAAIAAELLGWSDAGTAAQLTSFRRLAAGHGVPDAGPRDPSMA